jgi:hypothetical protein
MLMGTISSPAIWHEWPYQHIGHGFSYMCDNVLYFEFVFDGNMCSFVVPLHKSRTFNQMIHYLTIVIVQALLSQCWSFRWLPWPQGVRSMGMPVEEMLSHSATRECLYFCQVHVRNWSCSEIILACWFNFPIILPQNEKRKLWLGITIPDNLKYRMDVKGDYSTSSPNVEQSLVLAHKI